MKGTTETQVPQSDSAMKVTTEITNGKFFFILIFLF